LSIIGEVYDQSSEINGAIVNIRSKGTKIAVWTNNASKENGSNIMAIGYVKKLIWKISLFGTNGI